MTIINFSLLVFLFTPNLANMNLTQDINFTSDPNPKQNLPCNPGFYKYRDQCYRCEIGCKDITSCKLDGCHLCSSGYSRHRNKKREGIYICLKNRMNHGRIKILIISFVGILVVVSLLVLWIGYLIGKKKGRIETEKDKEEDMDDDYRFPPLESPKTSVVDQEAAMTKDFFSLKSDKKSEFKVDDFYIESSTSKSKSLK